MKKVLIAAPISKTFKEWLIKKNYELIFYPSDKIENNLLEGIVTSNKLLLDEKELQTYNALKWIARLGSGMEIIDTTYCERHDIKYFSSPNGISNAVAEHTIGMLLSLLHRIQISSMQIRNGNWIREENRGFELDGKVVGIIGYGHTGIAFAKKLSVFTKNILVFDKYKTNFKEDFFEECSLECIQENADIISFHVPLNQETTNYYSYDFFSKMKKNHILINTSRGPVTPSEVLLHGLKNGKIEGACLDVLEEEKNINHFLKDKNSSIYQLLNHNTILTPHIAGYTFDAIEKMSNELMTQLDEVI